MLSNRKATGKPMTAPSKYFYVVLLIFLLSGTPLAANATDERQTKSEALPPAATIVLPHMESVLGKTLVSASGETAGRIVDVLADETGQVRAVLVDYGGFLGVGSRKIAIAWSGLRFGSAGDPNVVAVDLSRENLASAPEVKAGQPIIVISARRPARRRSALQ
jgi:hypothetical protein